MSVATASKALLSQLSSLSANELEQLVTKHNALYWDTHAPELDDPTFDKLVEALRVAKPTSKVLLALGEKASAADVKHTHPMLSLDKCYDDDTLLKWAATVKKGGFFVTPKIDGLACSLRYSKAGVLERAATRGDGSSGEDITANAKGVKDIVGTIDAGGNVVEVRGEVYLRLSRFNSHYKDKANPRNLAAGALKMKDPAESKAYGLSFFAYDVIGTDAASERDKMKVLKAFGFAVLPSVHVADGKDLPQAYRDFVPTVKALDTETDGVVLKADLKSEHERLGATAHHPRGALAYKFQGEGAQTVIRDVEWSISRTGSVNPVAIVDAIFISGVTVTRVSLHNFGYAQKLGAGIGATVEVVRRGGVIPHVERVLVKPKTLLAAPKHLPSSSGNLEVIADGDFLRLKHPDKSPEVVADRVRHYTQMVDATGFGEKVLMQLVDAKLVKSPADLYRLTVTSLTTLERMGQLSAQKLVDMMQARRELVLSTFLVALGVNDIGKTVAEQLAEQFGTLKAIRALSQADLEGMHGIGPAIAASVVTGLKDLKDVIDDLLTEVKLVAPKVVANTGSVLFGKSVVFTGAMATLDRKSAQKRVLAVGGKTPAGVSAELDYLVIGDDGSPLLDAAGEKSAKHKAADKLVAKGSTLKIVSESDFLKMLT